MKQIATLTLAIFLFCGSTTSFAGVKSGDVWSLQNNTLRSVKGNFVDLGFDCQLNLKLKPYLVQGICSVCMNGHEGAGQEKVKNIINVKDIQSTLVWHKV